MMKKKILKSSLSMVLVVLLVVMSIGPVFAGKPVRGILIVEGNTLTITSIEAGTGTFTLSATNSDVNNIEWSIDSPASGVSMSQTQIIESKKSSHSEVTIEYEVINAKQVLDIVALDTTDSNNTMTCTVTINPYVITQDPPMNEYVDIDGILEVGELVRADYNWLNLSGFESYSYVWESANSNLKGKKTKVGDGEFYTIQSSDIDKIIRVTVTVTDNGMSDTGSSDWSAVVAESSTPVNEAPFNNIPPSISGEFVVSKTLTADPGTWTDDDGIDDMISYTFEWFSGDNLEAVSTADTYTTVAEDAEKTVYLVVTATDGVLSQSASSVKYSIEAIPVNEAPLNTFLPSITGEFIVGNTLTADPGTWTDDDGIDDTISYTYEWFINGNAVSTADTYTTVEENAGKSIHLFVTATDGILSSNALSGEDIIQSLINNEAPIAVPDNSEVNQMEEVVINVLLNDSDSNDDMLTIVSVSSSNATIDTANNQIIYKSKYPDIETFNYTISDGLVEVTSTVTVETIHVVDTINRYLALGDSIPSGVSGSGFVEVDYTQKNSDHLGTVKNETYFNRSVSGYNSVDIFNLLYSDYNQEYIDTQMPQDVLERVIEADSITLCIGANDIMDAVPRTGLFGTLDKYNIIWEEAELGRVNFEKNWQNIVSEIERLNPDVTLIVMTIYNPYNANTDTNYFNLVNPYFESDNSSNYGLNYIIRNTKTLYSNIATEFDYKVADVYQAFNDHADKDSLTGFYDSAWLLGDLCDPHPNQDGHNVIYETHLDTF